jgi:hypothetical protein
MSFGFKCSSSCMTNPVPCVLYGMSSNLHCTDIYMFWFYKKYYNVANIAENLLNHETECKIELN